MTYVLSDIHGNYEKFRSILRQINFREEDTMYILGDLVDFGDESMELISDLSVRLNVFSIAGEHDFLAARMLTGFDRMLKSGATPDAGYIAEMTQWVQNGGQVTLDGFRSLDADQREGVLEYLEELALFEEADIGGTHYLMVHAGISRFDPNTDLFDYRPEDFFTEPLDPDRPLIKGTTVLAGHIPTENGKIRRGKGSILLDCGAAEGGALGCLRLEDGKEFYA